MRVYFLKYIEYGTYFLNLFLFCLLSNVHSSEFTCSLPLVCFSCFTFPLTFLTNFPFRTTLRYDHDTEYRCIGLTSNMSIPEYCRSVNLPNVLVCCNMMIISSSVDPRFVSVNPKYLKFLV